MSFEAPKIDKNRKQTFKEEILNSISHGIMVAFSILYFFFILFYIKNVKDSHNDKKIAMYVMIFFILSIFFLYLSSTLYHSLSFTKFKKIFKKCDHISIYLLILGTFTPILFLLPSLKEICFNIKILSLSISQGLLFFLLLSFVVILGIFFKYYCIEKGNKVHIFLFLLLGWSSLIILKHLIIYQSTVKMRIISLLFLGGICYSLGVYFYLKDYKKYFHFIWHIFVILGTIFHVLSIHIFLNDLLN